MSTLEPAAFPLSGRVAIVTGGSSGIGRAACIAFAAAGAQVLVVGRDHARVGEAVDAARAAARAGTAVRGAHGIDVGREADVERVVGNVVRDWGRIDVLVCSAAVGRGRASTGTMPEPVSRLPLASWQEIVDTNLKGVFLANRAVLPVMLRQRGGQIVNLSSSRILTAGRPFAAAYAATKLAIVGFSQALAEEVRAHGIRVNVLLPDAVDTPLIRGTTLGAAGALSPDTVGAFLLEMVAFPEDALLAHPWIAPAGGMA